MTAAAREDLRDPRLTTAGLLLEVAQSVEAGMTPQLAEHGLSRVEAGVVLRLARSPRTRLRMSDLALQSDLSASGLTRVVDRLVRAGLVARDACTTDRRVTYAVLTPAGLQRVLELLPGHLDKIDELITRHLDAEDLDALLTALRTLRDAVRPGAVAGAETAAAAGTRSAVGA